MVCQAHSIVKRFVTSVRKQWNNESPRNPLPSPLEHEPIASDEHADHRLARSASSSSPSEIIQLPVVACAQPNSTGPIAATT